MHKQEIIDEIVEKLKFRDCNIYSISLICTPETLKERIDKDISNGTRSPDIVEKSISYLSLYRLLYTKRIDVSSLSPKQVVDIIVRL